MKNVFLLSEKRLVVRGLAAVQTEILLHDDT